MGRPAHRVQLPWPVIWQPVVTVTTLGEALLVGKHIAVVVRRGEMDF